MNTYLMAFLVTILVVVIITEVRVKAKELKINAMQMVDEEKNKLFNNLLELNTEIVEEYDALYFSARTVLSEEQIMELVKLKKTQKKEGMNDE